jgi:hypothetical protein
LWLINKQNSKISHLFASSEYSTNIRKNPETKTQTKERNLEFIEVYDEHRNCG